MRAFALASTILLCLGCEAPPEERPQTAPPGSAYEPPAFEFTRITEDIYHARGTGNLTVGSNGAIIINESDVLVVDSHISPAAATALLAELKDITDKPVRYVVNTHFHFDHAHGNQIYPPEVHVIGHEFTREMLASGGSTGRSYDLFVTPLPQTIEALKEEIAATSDPETRSGLEDQLASQENYWAGQQGLVPTAPNTTLAERMTLYRGGREIRLLFFGRGHTGGDVVVYLPAERVLVSGDLLLPGVPYMGDGFPVEWVETLEHLKELEFNWIVPGHGSAFQGRERIDQLQSYLRDLWTRAVDLHESGVSVEEAAARIDMTDHADDYPTITGPGVATPTMVRIFELLEGAGG